MWKKCPTSNATLHNRSHFNEAFSCFMKLFSFGTFHCSHEPNEKMNVAFAAQSESTMPFAEFQHFLHMGCDLLGSICLSSIIYVTNVQSRREGKQKREQSQPLWNCQQYLTTDQKSYIYLLSLNERHRISLPGGFSLGAIAKWWPLLETVITRNLLQR